MFEEAKIKADVHEKLLAARVAAASSSRKRQNHFRDSSDKSPLQHDVVHHQQPPTAFTSQLSKAIHSNHSSGKEMSDASYVDGSTNETTSSSISTTSATTTTTTPDFYYYYQANDGQHLFLHPLDIKLLKHEFGAYSAFPDKMDVDVIYLSDTTIDEDLRRRCKHLEHLPLSCDAGFVECDWSGVVSQRTMDFFASKYLNRRHLGCKDLILS